MFRLATNTTTCVQTFLNRNKNGFQIIIDLLGINVSFERNSIDHLFEIQNAQIFSYLLIDLAIMSFGIKGIQLKKS